MTTQIHGLPTPPLGCRLLNKGEKLAPFVLEEVEEPSPLAPGRNINGLTEDQVGVSEGWRLITEGEFKPGREVDVEGWDPAVKRWHDGPWRCNSSNWDYRTKAPLPVDEEVRHVYNICGVHYRLTVAESEILTSLAERFNAKEGN